jgi:multicomponent Na+:H+ antiporter subunit C
MSVVSAAIIASLYATGCYLLLQRALTRIVLGLALLGHGAVLLLLLAAGPPGRPPFPGGADPGGFSDPLPQALSLTAIVITFAILVFLLGLAYRSWLHSGDDTVEDDLEDARILSSPAARDRMQRDLDALEADLDER